MDIISDPDWHSVEKDTLPEWWGYNHVFVGIVASQLKKLLKLCADIPFSNLE